MSLDTLLLVAACVAAFSAFARLLVGSSADRAHKEVTRWRRFRVCPGAFDVPRRQAAQVVTEEPKGLRLLAEPGSSRKTVRVRTHAGAFRMLITDRWRPFSRRCGVKLATGSRLELVLPRNGRKKPAVLSSRPGERYELRGNLHEREYEILKGGRLVASVSWQREKSDEPPRKEYVVEALKTEDELPLLALALTVEAAEA